MLKFWIEYILTVLGLIFIEHNIDDQKHKILGILLPIAIIGWLIGYPVYFLCFK